MKILHFSLLAAMMLPLALPARAAPHVPPSDSTVLERLPFKPNDPVARAMSQLRGELRRDPNNVEVAVKLARRYYDLVGEEGDPRYLGYAQAALKPWWDLPQPPIDVLFMRASLKQFQHDFEGALADLGQLLERQPQHAEARALRAVIHIVQARYDQARTDCNAMRATTSALIATGCTAMVDGLTGHAGQAYQTLKAELEAHPQATPDEKLWVVLRLAEMAWRQGKTDLAERHFKDAVALGITNTFLYAAYADFLLDQNRPAEVMNLLKNAVRSDVLMLRLVFAEKALNLPALKADEDTLAARYAAAQMRGDTVHQQEEARFTLHIKNDPKEALRLALENWKVQLEPRDARIVLESALAAKEPAAAQPVLQWMEKSHIEDVVLANLAKKLKGGA